MKNIILVTFIFASFISCNTNSNNNAIKFNDELHTFSNSKEVQTTHLDWKAKVDFDKKEISGTATWNFKNLASAKHIVFDIYDLTIEHVQVNGKDVKYTSSTFNDDYGSGLSIPITANDSVVSITYHTGPNANALQWLEPSQTAGKKLPYLFTQCESIHARSLLPCQDLPGNRITYNAEVSVPKGMLAIMSAKNPTSKNETGIYNFEMEIPVPTYLIALAVGDISYQAIDSRSGVYTEPSMLEKSANELNDIPNMMKAAEELGGPYRWGKYDVLIAPPSFPIGGMENPRLTFATPTIIAGDKSLVSLIAHEMAHSWSGNLVTNATWDDLWLNEGFTTYFERRIMEKITDKSYTDMLWELGYQDMESDFNDMGMDNPDTRLKVDLKNRQPEDAFTNIPYEKGAVFLRMLEENVGREKFDKFLNYYFTSNAFIPMTTEKALAIMDKELFDGDTTYRNSLQVHKWVYEPGLPDNCPHVLPLRFKAVDEMRIQFEKSGDAKLINTFTWSTHEWLQFVRKLSHPLDLAKMKALDSRFDLSKSTNSEIADEWYKLAIASSYTEAYAPMETFLNTVGRKKFLEPLYSEMMKSKETKEMAMKIFDKSKMNYHPQTASKIESILKQ